MLFPAKINVIFGITTSNNAGISKIYAKIAINGCRTSGKYLSEHATKVYEYQDANEREKWAPKMTSMRMKKTTESPTQVSKHQTTLALKQREKNRADEVMKQIVQQACTTASAWKSGTSKIPKSVSVLHGKGHREKHLCDHESSGKKAG